ncbi:MAG: hypothetical protein WDM71_07880 [Ferruginibacter sp.]
MKKFIQTLKNIWGIEELRKKILFTLLLVFIYRVGSYIVLPGIDPNKLANLASSTQSGMLGLLDAFVGGAFHQASVFCIGYYAFYFCFHLYAISNYFDSSNGESSKRR